MSFWQQLKKPFFVVAPMADVTDVAFRRLIATYSAHERSNGTIGGPDVMWTEFVAADGLVRATSEGKQKLMADLLYSTIERPIVAQLFTSNEAHMEYAARLCLELGFDGVDINMGCPDRSIEKQGCGSAMIKTPVVAQAIIRAAKRGAKSDAGGIPVSVKTRLGYNHDVLEEWLPALLAEAPAAITLHARTRKEMSKVPARWERIARAVDIRNTSQSSTLILGNGDVLSPEDARQKAAHSGADGIMVGRALFGNPWFFHPIRRLPLRLTSLPTKGVDREDIIIADTTDSTLHYITIKERLLVLCEHAQLFTELLPHKNFAVMKKHFKAYVNGFAGAAELRGELMGCTTSKEVHTIVHAYLSK